MQEAIYEQLANAIVSGKLHPGERLTLKSISTQFSISNMPVREALRKLEANKLVKRERNRSICVTELSVQSIEEIIEIRLILECYAAGKAAQIRSDEAVDRLESLHKRITLTKVVEKYLQVNRDFHFTIYEEAKLPILTEIIKSLWERYSPYLYILHRNERRWPIESVLKNHQGLLEAVQNKDAERVKFWLTEDLRQATERLIRMMKERSKQ
jgi:DNA-binding GntR family transcriptional regulator